MDLELCRCVLEIIAGSRVVSLVQKIVNRVNRDAEDPRVFLLYEEYADEAAYRAHGESDHFRRLALEGAIPLLEGRERSFYESLDV